jgi:pimeloyl-ACP methyl ester carboxylesterase
MTIADLPARAALPNAPRVHFVDVCGQRLEYVDIAAHQVDRPPLLFLHEGLGSVSMWRDFPLRVAAHTGCRTVVYSRAGHGRSSPLAKPHAVGFMHDEALQVIPALREALAIERPVLIGHSTGASMALIHAGAGRWPVEGVVAMAPLCFVEEFNLDSIRKAREVFATTDLGHRLSRHHDDAARVFWSWNDIWLDPDFRTWTIEDYLPGIRCPILAVLGEDDEYSTPAQIELIAARAVHACDVELLRLADCRHSPHKDQPAAVIDAVALFLERIRS